MSFESLVKKLMKEGKSKTAATKIAGSVANAKMKGAGSGPTAKQKARAKSPTTKKPKPRAVIRDKDRVADKSRSYTDKKGKKIEIKTFKHEKAYDSGVKDDPNKPSMKRKSSRLSNTVELHKTKTKKDGSTKTKVKRAAGGTKKSQKLHTKFAKGKNKEGASDVTITRKSPTTMKKQMTDPKGQNPKDPKKSGQKTIKKQGTAVDKKILREPDDRGAKAKAPTKMKSPATKPLKGKQKSLPKELREAILKSPGKMLSESGIKMMDKSPATMKKPKRKSKQRVEQDYARNAIADYKSGKTKEAKYEKKKALEVAAGEAGKAPTKMKKSPSMMKGGEKRKVKKMAVKLGSSARPGKRTGNTEFKPMKMEPQLKKMEMATFQIMKPMKEASPTKMKSNQDGGGYAAKNPAAPARQLKKLGSILSKHMKSN